MSSVSPSRVDPASLQRRGRQRTTSTGLILAASVIAALPAHAETAIDVPTRPGQSVRALLEKPGGVPLGSVILLVGGHGNLALEKSGRIGWGKGNQLVRTRGRYAKAGFVTLVPDIARDLKQGDGVKPSTRWSREHAADLAAVVAHARTLAAPVYLIGTSRAALSVANAAVTNTSGLGRPDAIVVTAGMLVAVDDKQPSAQTNVPGLDRIAQPVLLMHHARDGCTYTPPTTPERFKPLLRGAARVDIRMLSGGSPGPAGANPCEADGHHGFAGQDDELVAAVTGWLKQLPRK